MEFGRGQTTSIHIDRWPVLAGYRRPPCAQLTHQIRLVANGTHIQTTIVPFHQVFSVLIKNCVMPLVA
jgi:hypothetical protein